MDSFAARDTLTVNGQNYHYCRLDALPSPQALQKLPYALKIVLENLLRFEDGLNVTKDDILALLNRRADSNEAHEIAFTPARVIMQDFTGVPAIVDLAAMRDAMQTLGGDPELINPLVPAELVIDHSVMVDYYGSSTSLERNVAKEFERNQERYQFLRWGQQAFSDFKVVPPRTGIVHQVNLEYLARVIFDQADSQWAYPDTLVGTDSHTTMINGLGVLGWGVGGIEAEAAMLGQPITMLVPDVVGFRLSGQLPEGATATDLVLTVTQMLRQHGVVGKFVEFFGPGLAKLPLADRATIANMAPEYGATCGIFPIDQETINYLRLSGRSQQRIDLTEAYAKAQGLFHSEDTPEAEYKTVVSLDLASVEPSLAGPKRPQDRIPLSKMASESKSHIKQYADSRQASKQAVDRMETEGGLSIGGNAGSVSVDKDGQQFDLQDGAVAIAAITSCTNTSNPSVIMAAGLLARNAVKKGLKAQPWVKTSLAPGSKVVTEYLQEAGLLDDLQQLGFDVVGYGCTTCIGNSGPLHPAISQGINQGNLTVCSVLSGNRNFEGRVHPEVKMNFLASPPLVVAYALAGNTQIDLYQDPIGHNDQGEAVYLKDIWPSQHEIQTVVAETVSEAMFKKCYDDVFAGDAQWQSIDSATGQRYDWSDKSTYIQNPPYFTDIKQQVDPIEPIRKARVLALLGDSITTDHISPAGAIKADSPAGEYLKSHGVKPSDFNSYGSRRGNHEVMMRGTFANIRLRNLMAPGTEGGWTRFQPSGETLSIYDAAMKYQQQQTPLVVISGKEYGTGSSRDWAAKGTRLLGVRAVIAESYERIHRSNLVGMGVLPLQFNDGEGRESLNLTGEEVITIADFREGDTLVTVTVENNGEQRSFDAKIRIDTPKEWEYYQHGGILHYVLRQLASQ